MIAEDYGQFIDRLPAEAKAQKSTQTSLERSMVIFRIYLPMIFQDLDRINELPGRTFIPELVKLGHKWTDGRFMSPWTQATYLMVANKKALAYLPAGADINALT